MEVTVNSAGERIFINMPYIDQSELKRNLILYDPNGYNLDTGLYSRTQPTCQRWVDHIWQWERQNHAPPMYTVNQYGETSYVQDAPAHLSSRGENNRISALKKAMYYK